MLARRSRVLFDSCCRFGPRRTRYNHRMTLKARVKAGRLVVDEPTDLPDGTEIELLPLDPGDWLDESQRAALHQALRDSDEDVTAGRLVDAEAVLRELRSR
jgi:hypothetical protein